MKADISAPVGFVKLKRRTLSVGIIRAVLVGTAVGALIAGVLILLPKLKIFDLPLHMAVLIAVGAFLVSGALTFLISYRTPFAVARMLDSRFDLKEKVQTMMAYREREEAIYALQRSDAEAEIERIPKRGIRIRCLWIYIVCLVLSIGVLVCAVAYTPVEPPPPPVEEIPFEITSIQIAAMEELIGQVSGSKMESPYRENVVAHLTALLDELKLATTETERDNSIGKALKAIYNETDASSSAVEIIEALWSSGNDRVKALAVALNYYEWQDGSEWDEYVAALADVREGYIHADSLSEAPDEAQMVADIAALLSDDSSEIVISLTRSGISPSDALYAVVSTLATSESEPRGLAALAQTASGLLYAALEGEIDSTFAAMTPEFYTAIEQSSVNTDTGESAMSRVCGLFDYPLPAFERPILRDSSTESGDSGGDDIEGGGMGGIGTGTVYGSDDLVLDPYTDEYVEYGTILDKYYSLMFGKTEDGDYTEDQIAALKKYFEILYGGFEDQE